ncbi:MAG TPA: Gfo/Idh/MocA family oxidoreductase [Firmicutes bacterium]|nr:Gfo/Idh/MocA family oxidoreductase [Bacillota bacterium]
MRKLRVGVIGLGHNGLAFCRAYASLPDTELVAVCDRDEQRAEAAQREFGVKAYYDYAILERDDIDIISIHTPDHLHREPFIKALEADKHILLEKPMANSIEDLKLMVKAADRSKKKVAVGQILRFNPMFEAVKRLVDNGILGEIAYLEADYYHDLRYQRFMERWKLDEEIPIVGGGVHPFDLLRWYAGEAVEVTSYSNHKTYPEMKADTSIVSIFRFKSGCTGKVGALYGSPLAMPEYYNLGVYGTKASFCRGRLACDGIEGWMNIPIQTPPGHPFEPEIVDLVRAIREGREPRCNARDGAMSALGVLCAYQSAIEGKAIKIPEDF